MSYYVVFEGTGGPKSNYPGIRTWTPFESEAHLERWIAESGNKDIVVAKGVTTEEALRLTRATTGEARALAVFLAAMAGSNLEHELQMASWAANEEGHSAEFFAEVDRLAQTTEFLALLFTLIQSEESQETFHNP